MADRLRRRYDIHVEYCFDRLLLAKLEQVYAILVPDRSRRIGGGPCVVRGELDEDGRDLRSCVLGSAEAGTHHRQPDAGVDSLRRKRRLQRAIRLDLLEHVVWSEIMRLLEDPAIIESELERRLDAACNANPTKRDHQEQLARDRAQLQKRMERLLTAYQEDLLSLDELRHRMPELRRREQHLHAELESLNTHLADQSAYLRLAHTLTDFLARMRTQAQSLDVRDRQQVIRLLVKDVVIGKDSITIRHSIPSASPPSGSSGDRGNSMGPTSDDTRSDGSFHLRPWRVDGVAGPPGLVRVVADHCTGLLAVQRLDRRVAVLRSTAEAWPAQCCA